MKHMKHLLIPLVAASATLLAGTASAHCAYHQASNDKDRGQASMSQGYPASGFVLTGGYKPATATPDIVDTAVSAGSFNTLVQAAQAAGLVEVLKGEGPYTVFAPTDAAFAKLPAGTLEGLLADKQKLAQVLKYHVVPGRLDAATVTDMTRLATVEGS